MNPVDRLHELTKEMDAEHEKNKRLRIPLLIFASILGIAGVILLAYHGNWQICLAVFLLLWGNNVMLRVKSG
jgi:fatty acid desaturase